MKRVVLMFALAVAMGATVPARADDVAEAREHFRKGSRAFDLGHYTDAVKEYEAAYNIKEDPALLFNIAQAYRLNGDSQNALRAYKSFLHRMPDAPNRTEVERRIAELQKAVEQESRAKEGPPEGVLAPSGTPAVAPSTKTSEPATQPAPPDAAAAVTAAPADAHPGRTKKIAGLAIAGVGVGAVVVGAVFASLAVKAGNDLTRLNDTMGTFSASTQATGKTDQLVGGICFGIGGAAIVTGGVVFALGHRDASRAAPRAALTIFAPSASAAATVR